MKSLFRYILFLILLNVGFAAKAETVYPIQLYATILPPYTNCISDYVNDEMKRLKLTAVVRDMQGNHSNSHVKVLVKVKSGNEVKVTASTYPQILNRGNVLHEINAGLSIVNALNDPCLPEGPYEFVFQMFDAYNQALPLSEPVSVYCYLSMPEPPFCVYPPDGECIAIPKVEVGNSSIGEFNTPTNSIINFTWMDAVASNMSTKIYEFELFEDISQSSTAFNGLNPMFGGEDYSGKRSILQKTVYNTNVFTLNVTAATIKEGGKYYWHVKNITDGTNDTYSGGVNKYSQLASFTYGGCNKGEEIVVNDIKDLDDKLEVKTIDVDSKKVSATITWGLVGSDNSDDLKKFCKYKLYFTTKKEKKEEESEAASDNTESTAVKTEPADETNDNESDDKDEEDSNVEFVVDVDNATTYTISTIERLKEYDVKVEGYVCDDKNEIAGKTEPSEPKDFMVPALSEKECKVNLDEVTCAESELVELAKNEGTEEVKKEVTNDETSDQTEDGSKNAAATADGSDSDDSNGNGESSEETTDKKEETIIKTLYNWFYANDMDAIVKVTEATCENGACTGKGVVSCTLFKDKLGLNVTFVNIKVNKDHQLCDGTVKVVTNPTENNLMANANDIVGKGRTAPKAGSQSTVSKTDKETITTNTKNSSYRNNIAIDDNSQAYSVSHDGKSVEIGKVVADSDKPSPSVSSLDNDNGVIVFGVDPELNKGSYSPYIDYTPGKITETSIIKGYDRMGVSYIVPWLSMVSGDSKWIKATPQLKNGDKGKMDSFKDVVFYARVGTNYIELKSKELKNSEGKFEGYQVQVFGGEHNKSYTVFAMSKDKSKTFGRLNVYSMKYKELKVKLIPFVNAVTLSTDFEKNLNNIFAPLGRKFELDLSSLNKPLKNKDITTPYKNYSNLDFLTSEGLNTGDGIDIMGYKTADTKALLKLYKNNGGKDDEADGYLFFVPKFKKDGLKGFMPRTYSVGFLSTSTVGESQTNVIYSDYKTMAHELCHGMFGLEHIFAYSGVGQGGLPENLMDYADAETRYPSKYFQWYNIENPSDFHFPFVDDAEDGEAVLYKALADPGFKKCGGQQAVLDYLVGKRKDIIEYCQGFSSVIFRDTNNAYVAVSAIQNVLNSNIKYKKYSYINNKKEAQYLLFVVLYFSAVNDVYESSVYKKMVEEKQWLTKDEFNAKIEKNINKVCYQCGVDVIGQLYGSYMVDVLMKSITQDIIYESLLSWSDKDFTDYIEAHKNELKNNKVELENNEVWKSFLSEALAAKKNGEIYALLDKITSLEYVKSDVKNLAAIITKYSDEKLALMFNTGSIREDLKITIPTTVKDFLKEHCVALNAIDNLISVRSLFGLSESFVNDAIDAVTIATSCAKVKFPTVFRYGNIAGWAKICSDLIVKEYYREQRETMAEEMLGNITWSEICDWSLKTSLGQTNILRYPMKDLDYFYVNYSTSLFNQEYNPNVIPTSVVIQDEDLAKEIFGFVPTHVLFNMRVGYDGHVPNRKVEYKK